MKQTSFRPYAEADIPQILNLMKSLEYQKKDIDLKQDINLFLSFPLNRIFLAICEKKVVGYIAIAFHHLLVTSHYRCRIENLIIDVSYRRKGIGEELVGFAEKYALSCNASIMDVTSSDKRKKGGAHDFYKNVGYINNPPEKRTYFRKRIKEN